MVTTFYFISTVCAEFTEQAKAPSEKLFTNLSFLKNSWAKSEVKVVFNCELPSFESKYITQGLRVVFWWARSGMADAKSGFPSGMYFYKHSVWFWIRFSYFKRTFYQKLSRFTFDFWNMCLFCLFIIITYGRGNSQCILGTVKDSRKMDEVYYL